MRRNSFFNFFQIFQVARKVSWVWTFAITLFTCDIVFSALLSDEASLKDCDRLHEDGNGHQATQAAFHCPLLRRQLLIFYLSVLINPLLTADINV